MLISAAGPLVLFSMQLGWMREPGFQHTPIGINLAMLAHCNNATGSFYAKSAGSAHTHTRSWSQINCCYVCVVWLFVATKAFLFSVLWDAYINHLSSVQTDVK